MVISPRYFVLVLVLWIGLGFGVRADSEREQVGVDLYVAAGMSYLTIDVLLDGGANPPAYTSGYEPGFLLGAGALNWVDLRHGFGIYVSLQNVDSDSFVVVAPVDYRYLFSERWRLKAQWGLVRYDKASPAYGFQLMMGVEFKPLSESFGINFDFAIGNKIERDRVLPEDPPETGTPEIFYDTRSVNTYLAWYF